MLDFLSLQSFQLFLGLKTFKKRLSVLVGTEGYLVPSFYLRQSSGHSAAENMTMPFVMSISIVHLYFNV